ncbi:23S rRNA (adenine(2030)-N(6))-methyltransferase RlmJ [Treponema primitia]|uniref:23S rRNA (adenine(2030)-N(6))-methyltransferase RlmJ n=1 Tax=Treponema primitia TaxID=88058 RepID=UPI00398058FF
MLSYRHGFHAGNTADVLKHAVLIYCMEYLGQKEAPFLVIDTHSGAGRYFLTGGYAAQNREWEQGVGRLMDQAVLPPLLDRYVALVRESLGTSLQNARRYPGSPALIQRLLRFQDRAVCFELHPADFTALEETLTGDRRFRVLREDGFGGLKALLPPPSRRGCVFIDPSYEMKSDYEAVPEKLAEALRRFPTGLYIIWYPLLVSDDAGEGATLQETLRETLLGLYGGNRCAVELRTRAAGGGGKRLYGSGLVIYNPPFTLRKTLEESLPALADLLEEGQGSWDLRWEDAMV